LRATNVCGEEQQYYGSAPGRASKRTSISRRRIMNLPMIRTVLLSVKSRYNRILQVSKSNRKGALCPR
jgi:hypothetical protein